MILNALQLEKIRLQLKDIKRKSRFYGCKYKNIEVEDISSQEQFEELPFTQKSDLRDAYPLGLQAVDDEKIVRIHSSSGTTGTPVVIPYTKKDVDDWAKMFVRCYEIAGVSKKDRIQITPGYGFWTAGIGFQAGAEALGAMAVPMGPGNTEKQLKMMKDLQTSVLCATSSYAFLLAEEIKKRGMLGEINLKKAIVGSECWNDKMRDYIAGNLSVEIYDIYGLTEIYGPGIGISCRYNRGIHYWDDYIYLEIIDPKSGTVLPDGELGEIVITTLEKEGAPLIRYRTHDLSRIIPGKCECGCPFPRLDRIYGRSDDMFKIKGVNMFPKQVEEILGKVPGASSQYMVKIFRESGKDIMKLQFEIKSGSDAHEAAEEIQKRFKSCLNITPQVEAVQEGELPRSEKKSVRVIDYRQNET